MTDSLDSTRRSVCCGAPLAEIPGLAFKLRCPKCGRCEDRYLVSRRPAHGLTILIADIVIFAALIGITKVVYAVLNQLSP